MTEQLLFIDIDSIELHPVVSSWRLSYEDVQDLAFDVKRNGVLEPVLVRPINGGKYQLLAGNRRYHAAKLAGLKQIPARVLHVDDSKALEIALSENLHRRDLNPVELARAFKSLVDQGYRVEEIAKMFGKSRPWVSNHIRILRLPDFILNKIASGDLSLDHGIALLKLTWHPERLKEVFDWIFDEYTCQIHGGVPSVRALRIKVEQTLKEIAREERRRSWGFDPHYLCNVCRHWGELPVTKERYEKGGYKCPECGSTDLTIGSWVELLDLKWKTYSSDNDSEDRDSPDFKEVKIEHNIPLDKFVKQVIDIIKEYAEISSFEVSRMWSGSTKIYITFKKTDEPVLPSFTAGKKTVRLITWSSQEGDEEKLQNLLRRVENGKE